MEPRQAEWHPLPEAERPHAWQTVLRETPLWQGVLIVALTSFVVLASVQRIRRHESFGWIAPQFALIGYLMYGMSAISRIKRPSRRLAARLRAEKPGEVSPVLLTILRDDRPTGQDEGIVSFDGGMLSFRGEQTEFRLRRSDVVFPRELLAKGPLIDEPGERRSFGNRSDAWGFRLAHEERYRLYFFPLKASGFPSVYGTLARWLEHASEPEGETILPPLDPLPGYRPPKPPRGAKVEG